MLPYYPFWWADYSAKTFNLTQGQHGAYLLFLRHIYTEGTTVPDADRYSIARAVLEQEQANADFILNKFFIRQGDQWFHSRAFEVLEDAHKAHEKRVNAGKKGGQAKAENAKQSPSIARAVLEQCSSNQNQNQIAISEDIAIPTRPEKLAALPSTFLMPDGTMLSFDGFFERLWTLYPAQRDKGHKGKARDQLKIKIEKGSDYETIGRGVARYRRYCDATGEKQPDMFRWIRDEGWKRDYTIPAGEAAQSRRPAGYSIQAAHAQAMADTTRRPEGREQRLADLGLLPDTGDV